MFCRFCGASLFNDSTFCHACGKSLATTTMSASANATGTTVLAPAPAPTTVAVQKTETEKTFLSLPGVTVTNSRIMVPGQTYAMAGITSVNYAVIPAKRGWPIFMAFTGLLFLLLKVFAFGAILLIVGVLWAALLKTQYALALRSASGEVRAVVSTDSAYVSRIVQAVNEAIVYRS